MYSGVLMLGSVWLGSACEVEREFGEEEGLGEVEM